MPAMIVGSSTMSSLVTEAPMLPAPKTPSAKPWRSLGNQAAFHEMPTLNRLPANPTRKASPSSGR